LTATPPIAPLPDHLIEEAVRRALAEDRPWGDLTSDTLLPAGVEATLTVRAKQGGVICGLALARAVFGCVDPVMRWEAALADGARIEAGMAAAVIRGEARRLLQGERAALNFLQRLSGIATLTAAYVSRAREGSPRAVVTDTRKTTPSLRALEKYAVRCGGGTNHRFGLSDAVLVKDNHLAVLAKAGIALKAAIAQARRAVPHTARIEIEVESLEAAREALEAGADILLLDNMSDDEMRQAVALCRGRCLTEASGNISLERIASVAATGVDLISVGALTHSAPALDLSLDFVV
jgi:nicotinate-nucleotide pyrophosphorylase (carboxylating)